MKKYLLDSNIIINLWKKDEKTLNKLIKQNKLLILEEVLKELSIKEAKIYRSKEVLSERFCELLPFALKINKQDISGFYFILDYIIKEKFKNNNLSENDFLQLFACYINRNLKNYSNIIYIRIILDITEEKYSEKHWEERK